MAQVYIPPRGIANARPRTESIDCIYCDQPIPPSQPACAMGANTYMHVQCLGLHATDMDMALIKSLVNGYGLAAVRELLDQIENEIGLDKPDTERTL